MKTLTALFVGFFALFGTMAAAQEAGFFGNAEYAVEKQQFELNVGADYTYNGVTFAGLTKFDDKSGNFEFVGAEVGMSYGVSENVDLYTVVEFDEDLEYDEWVVGAAWRF